MSTIKTEVIHATPDWATKVLEDLNGRIEAGTFRQRPVSREIVRRYASDMMAGSWKLNHQGVAFDRDGNLVDGQHRLYGIVESRVTVPLMVTTGLPTEPINGFTVMDSIDRGRPRSIGNQLAIHGMAHQNNMAAIAKAICGVQLGTSHFAMTVASTLAVLKQYKHNIDEVWKLGTVNKHRSTPLLACLALYHAAFPRKARDFAIQVFNMEDLKKDTPALTYVRWQQNQRARSWGREMTYRKLQVVANCLYNYQHGEPQFSATASDEARSWLAGLDTAAMKKIRAMFLLQKA